ncbi:MAG: preprotein translocase subunit SecG [Acidobacteriota bacterium]|nr:MAG: preprotein translocase subunit SecG [Acidobacteriota bacterium]
MGPILVVLHILVSLFLILVVLLQPGKGVDLSAFGGGASQTFFGARGTTSFFAKLTVGAAVLFLATSLLLSYLSTGGTRTVLDSAAPVPAEPMEAEEAGGLELPDVPVEAPGAEPQEGEAEGEAEDSPVAVSEPQEPGEAEGEAGDEGAETP